MAGSTSLELPKPASGCWPHWLAPIVVLPLVVAACFIGLPGAPGLLVACSALTCPAPSLLPRQAVSSRFSFCVGPTGWSLRRALDPASSGAPLKERLNRFTWPRMLEEEEVMRGLSYYGSGTALRRLAVKLLAGQPVQIVSLGGSITGTGGEDPTGTSYIARLFQHINATFPHPGHTMRNNGLPGRGSAQVEPCLARMVSQDTDLVVIEFAINDAIWKLPEPSYNSTQRRTYEQLLRGLLARPSKPAVLILQAYPWLWAAGDGVTQGLYYREPENQMNVLAEYYDIPVVSLRAAAWRLMHAGIDKFKVDKVGMIPCSSMVNDSLVTPVAPVAVNTSYFYTDCVHPSHQSLLALAELLIHPLARAVVEVAAGLQPKRRADPRLEGMPPPMIPGTPDRSSSVCFMLEDFKGVVKAANGFVYRPERPDAETFVQQKWAWSGTGPGDWAEMELNTQLGGTHPGSLVTVYMSFLVSYKDMGAAVVNCTAGYTCGAPTVTAHRPDVNVSIFVLNGLMVTQHPQCRVRVTIVNIKKPDPKEGLRFVMDAVFMRPISQ